jgi:phosphoribosylformimino-5-aminoimidazole carboxamide ribotide isomerase
MLLIPAIDLASGRCVRLRQGNFADETCYSVSPRELLLRYEALGARWVHVVDLDGAKDGLRVNHSVITALAAASSLKLQVGGGIRRAATIEVLLAAGVARVVIGTAAVQRPQKVLQWLKRFGAERLCLAFDVRVEPTGEPHVRTHGWSQRGNLTLWDALAPYSSQARHVLCTDIARDGMLSRPNLDLYATAIAAFPHLQWQASGGIRDAVDLAALSRAGLAAAISGKALLEARICHEELRPFLPDASSPASTYATARS